MSDGVWGQAAARENGLDGAYLEQGSGYGWLPLSRARSSILAVAS
jgi:hypothetical protein